MGTLRFDGDGQIVSIDMGDRALADFQRLLMLGLSLSEISIRLTVFQLAPSLVIISARREP